MAKKIHHLNLKNLTNNGRLQYENIYSTIQPLTWPSISVKIKAKAVSAAPGEEEKVKKDVPNFDS